MVDVFIKKIYHNRLMLFVLMFFSLIAIYPNIYILRLFLSNKIRLIFRSLFIGIIYFQYVYRIYERKKIDIFFIACLFFSLYQLFSTIINRADIISVIYSNLMISICCLMIHELYLDINKELYIDAIFWYFALMILICVPIYYIVDIDMSFLDFAYGNRNDAFRYNLPLAFVTYCKFSNKKYIAYIINIFLLLLAIISGAYTSSIIFLILLLYMIFFSNKNIKIFNIYIFVILAIIISILFITPKLNRIILSNIMLFIGKDATASGRFNIYDAVINDINLNNIIIGHGYPLLTKFHEVLIANGCYPNGSCHNTFLEIMYRYGIIGIIVSFILLNICHKTINISSNLYLKNIAKVSFLSLFLWFIPEPVWFYNILFIIGLCIYQIGSFEFDLISKEIVYRKQYQ